MHVRRSRRKSRLAALAGAAARAGWPAACALVIAACGGGAVRPAPGSVQPTVVTSTSPSQLAPSTRSPVCADTRRVLAGLRETMHVEAYVTRGLLALDKYVDGLRDLLQRYEAASGGKLHVTINEIRDEAMKQKALADGLVEVNWGEASADGKSASMRKGVMGMVFRYGREVDAIKALAPDDPAGLELWITMALRHVRDRADVVTHRIGVLAREGGPRLDEPDLVLPTRSTSTIRELVERHFPYRFVDVDPKRGELDPALEGLVILQPAKDFTDEDLRRIDAFVMKGKSLFVVASAANVAAGDPTMTATVDRHRLDTLLGGYGIELHEDVVVDFGRNTSFEVMTPAGVSKLRLPALLEVRADERFTGAETLLDDRFGPFFRVPIVTLPFTSSVAVRPAVQPGARLRVVARSTPRANVERGPLANLSPLRQWAPREPFVQVGVAAAAEGRLRSAFGKTTSERPAKVLAIASSSFLANPFVRAARGNTDESTAAIATPYAQNVVVNTVLAFKSTLDWMTTDDLAACSLDAAAPRGATRK